MVYVPRRYLIEFMCFLAILFVNLIIFNQNYFMRVNLSVTTIEMKSEFGWTGIKQNFLTKEQTKGNILSSFYWGYILLQIPGSILAAKYGSV